MIVREIDLDVYEDFLSDVYHTPFHDVGMFNKLESEGKNPRIYGGFLNDELVIAMMVSILPWKKVFTYMSCAYGYVAREPMNGYVLDEFFRGVKKCVRYSNILALRMESYIERAELDKDGKPVPNGYDNRSYIEMMEGLGWDVLPFERGVPKASNPQQCSIIDICRLKNWNGYSGEDTTWLYSYTDKDLLTRMRGNTKREVKRSLEDFIVIREGGPEELYGMCLVTAKEKGYEIPTLETIKGLKDGYGDKCRIKTAFLDVSAYEKSLCKNIDMLNGRIKNLTKNPKKKALVAELQDQYDKAVLRLRETTLKLHNVKEVPLASAMFLYSDFVNFYMFSGTSRNHLEMPGATALLWDTMLESIENGVWHFNLLGVHGDYTKEEAGYSLFDYKRGLGARVAEYCGLMVYPLNTALYETFMRDKLAY